MSDETLALPDELGDLVGALADGTITSAGRERLADLLRSSQIAREYYSDYLDVHAALYEELGGMACGVPEVLASARRSRRSQRRLVVILSLAAMAAAVVLSLHWFGKPASAPAARAGMIVDGVDCKWSLPIGIGDELPRKAVMLETGTAEIRLASGAVALVSAPAELRILDENTMALRRGTLYARVPKAAIGFRVNAPSGSVIDLGTEFGVRVTDEGAFETHVVTGLVRMVTADERQTAPVAAGEARLVHPQAPGEIRRIAFAGERFPKSLPAVRTGIPDGIRWEMLPTDQGIVYAKRPDDSVAYRARVMPSAGEGPSWQLTEVGPAMFFDGRDDYLQTDFLGVGDDAPRTVAFWAKIPPGVTGGGETVVPMISWGSFERDGGVWQISWNNRERDGVVGGLRIGAWGGQVVGKTDLRDGAWHHLAVVMQGGDMASGISLYVDGKLEESSMQNVDIRTLLIENMRIGRSIEGKHYFRGWLADVQVYEGALSADQVAAAARVRRLSGHE